jgi:ArsR family transcriptional regulator
MQTTEAKLRTVESQVAALTRRVERLEGEGGGRSRRRSGAWAGRPGDDLALLEQLRGRQAPRYRAKGQRGAIAYAGAVVLGERECLWIREHPLPAITSLDANRVAPVLASLGHPARLILLRALLEQACTSQELQAVLGVTSPGQLYHHLKELLSAGIVTQTSRSRYEVAARQVVPVLAVLSAAADLSDTTAVAPDGEGPAEKGKED